MKTLTLGLMTVVLAGVSASPGLAQKGRFRDVAPQHGWTEDLPAAMTEAKRTGKPVIVLFRCMP